MRYLPQSLMVRAGERAYFQSLTDATGLVPPHTELPVYFAVTGSADGSRNNLSPRNDFMVLLSRVAPDPSPAVAPAAPAATAPRHQRRHPGRPNSPLATRAPSSRTASAGTAWGLTDGSAGLRGQVLRSDAMAEVKLFLATFMSGMASGMQETRPTVLGTEFPGTTRNAAPSGEVAASSATNAVLFFRDAVTAELNQQRTASQAIIDQSQQLLTNIHSLSDQARSLQQFAEDTARMRSQ